MSTNNDGKISKKVRLSPKVLIYGRDRRKDAINGKTSELKDYKKQVRK